MSDEKLGCYRRIFMLKRRASLISKCHCSWKALYRTLTWTVRWKFLDYFSFSRSALSHCRVCQDTSSSGGRGEKFYPSVKKGVKYDNSVDSLSLDVILISHHKYCEFLSHFFRDNLSVGSKNVFRNRDIRRQTFASNNISTFSCVRIMRALQHLFNASGASTALWTIRCARNFLQQLHLQAQNIYFHRNAQSCGLDSRSYFQIYNFKFSLEKYLSLKRQ